MCFSDKHLLWLAHGMLRNERGAPQENKRHGVLRQQRRHALLGVEASTKFVCYELCIHPQRPPLAGYDNSAGKKEFGEETSKVVEGIQMIFAGKLKQDLFTGGIE